MRFRTPALTPALTLVRGAFRNNPQGHALKGDTQDARSKMNMIPAQNAQSAPVTEDRVALDRSVCVIANPGSGRRDKALFDTIQDELSRAPGRHDLRVVEDGADPVAIARQAIEDDFDTLVAAGGDGTIGAVTSALFQAHQDSQAIPHLAIIPLGTFNYVARSLDLPLDDPAAATRVALTGAPRPLAIGDINGQVFLNNASLGAYPAILDQREDIYRRFGRSRVAAYWSVVRALMTLGRPLSLKIDVDGQQIRRKSPLAFIANSAYQLEQFDLPGADAIRDHHFAVFVSPDTGRYRMILSALRLAGRTARLGRDMELVTGRSVTIWTRQKSRLIARDGEKETMKGPFRFCLHSDIIQVITPSGAQSETTTDAA